MAFEETGEKSPTMRRRTSADGNASAAAPSQLPHETEKKTATANRNGQNTAATTEAKLPKPHNDDLSLPLYCREDIPEYLADNAYILRHYRAFYPTSRCITSIFRMHNETINIWSHLIGVAIFIGLIAWLFTSYIVPEYHAGNVYFQENRTAFPVAVKGEKTTWPFIIFGAFSFACVMCMLCSACFHTFLCHMSEDLFHRAHALDYFGITFLIVGSFLPFCYYAMGCAPGWRNAYISMICTFGVIGLIGPFFRHWTSTGFANKRTLFYVLMVASGLIPTVHLAFMIPLAIGFPYVFGLLLMLALYGIGVFIYAFRIPEVFAPGKYDIYFSSHQIWHVCVMAAAITHFYNCTAMYLNRANIVCT
jgi:adiponectin receptor